MPEYLSPGVYGEETSFRAKFIEGQSTSTCGIVGQTSFGPTDGRPEVVTSFSEYQHRYGGWDDLVYRNAATPPQINHTAHAVRAFFDNGGQRMYVARVFAADGGDLGVASIAGGALATIQARYPGSWGNRLRVKLALMRTGTANLIALDTNGNPVLRGVYEGAVVQTAAVAPVPDATGLPDPTAATTAYVAYQDGVPMLRLASTNAVIAPLPPFAFLLELQLQVFLGNARNPEVVYSNIGLHKNARNFVGKMFDIDTPHDPTTQVSILVPNVGPTFDAGALLLALLAQTPNSAPNGVTLSGGNDGAVPPASAYQGDDTDELHPSGLYALGHLDDVSIVLCPDAAAGDDIRHAAINNFLIEHCEELRYRFAILDEPQSSTSTAALAFRSKFDSSYAGIYYPWIRIDDPRTGHDGQLLTLPPSGSLAGIYARTDVRRGVWKSPANESVHDAIDFEFHIHKGVQDVLNPRAVNCLRFFEEGGFRVWGARTLSSDPEWKYVSVRRLFLYLEHSIDKGLQWVVFEPNNEATWANVRQAVADFLLVTWKQGALMGTKPEQAFFVRCDRTTMTQNDLDNGRLVCLIGVAPAYPAEFVIFRIGQFTADSKPA